MTNAGSAPETVGAGAVILSARIGPSHDGAAELVLEIGTPGGPVTILSVEEEPAFAAVAAAGVSDIAELVGREWQVVLGGVDRVRELTEPS